MTVSVWLWTLMLVLLVHHQPSLAKQDKSLYCSICRAVVQEINLRISESDPSKTVKVSSFRMGVNGKKHVVEKPYARSNEHLSKVFGEVCATMKDYGLRQLPDRKLTVVRVKSRAGVDLDVQNVGSNENLQNTFKSYCESLIDDSEDDMWTLFKLGDLHTIETELCGKLAGMCTEEDLTKPYHGDPEQEEEYGQYTGYSTFSTHRQEEQEEEVLASDGEEEATTQQTVIEPISNSTHGNGKRTEL